MSTVAARWPARSRLAVVSPPVAVAVLVSASAAIRFALALERSAHRYLPDEFLYGQLARSLAEGDGLRVLGQPAGLTSFLQPVLTTPLWLPGDAELAFRFTQLFNAVAMSLAAVLVYLIARELDLGRWTSVACSAAAVVSPDLVYVGYVTSDAAAYTLALAAILLGVRLLARPTAAGQLVFLAAAGLAATARLQYAVLLPVVLAAGLVVERGQLTTVARRYGLLVASLGLAGVATGVAGDRVLGRYAALLEPAVSWEAVRWVGVSAFVLALASGVVCGPAAVGWAGAELFRPTARTTAGFAAVLVALIASMLTLAAVVGVQSGSPRFFERYLMVIVPLAFTAGAAGLRRQDRGALSAAVALGSTVTLVAVLALVPISEFTAGQGRADSPLLLAASMLEETLGIGAAALLVALAGTVAASVGLLAARGGIGAPLALGPTLAILCAVSVGAHAADRRLSDYVTRTVLGSNPGWVDAAGLSAVLLVQAPGSVAGDAMITTLRNISITAATTLGDVDQPIEGTGRPLRVLEDGALRQNGVPVRRPLLVSSRSSRLVFDGAVPIARSPVAALYGPAHGRRLAAIIEGLAPNGALAKTGRLVLFRAGGMRCLQLTLAAERNGPPNRVRFGPPAESRVVAVAPTKPAKVAFRAARRQTIEFSVAGSSGITAAPVVGPCRRG